ncbi:bile acid:sodium symporter family protein [Streptomyces candidus]|uniref:BASS family bile acid:Na+ symporter n=1 Tax=Streptomyces candidus TaxID=67283 RepID=A0A7X0LQP8_9ACTN|nr:bile acid:sodium symporter family protein [Streptomyces candidus]MBB6437833.1 BASS family bile acid:Na+ symporter [Streptomyces candidus]GHH50054.1 transporter [Streptomyces candidus]
MGIAGVLLPFALGIIMFGLGLGLVPADFRRVLSHPKVTLVALSCQVVLLPVICFGLVLAFGLPPVLAVGMMLLVASPGGTTANLFSHLYGGDVALNVTLTAVNSMISVVTLPLVFNLSAAHFFASGSENAELGLQFTKTLQVFAIVLIPVLAGMYVRSRAPQFALRTDRPVRIFSVVVLALIIVGALVQERENLAEYLAATGPVSLALLVVSLGVGYWIPRLLRVGRRQAIACCMEVGLHNTTLAITIALSIVGSTEMAVPGATYGVLMYFAAAGAGWLLRRGHARTTSPATTTGSENA